MATKDPHFQLGGANRGVFLVEIDGVEVGRFTECQGLQVEVEVETFTEGGVNGFEHKLTGRMSWPNLVLKRGLTVDNRVFGWFQEAAGATPAGTGKVTRGTLGITLLSSQGERLRTWRVYDAIPIKWTGPTLANTDDEVPTEELEIAHHGFEAETL
ncbi:MAG: phage tail protein, partial [Nitriliruptoraceae bacterium]